jgi:ribosomal protein L11 methyltransferase
MPRAWLRVSATSPSDELSPLVAEGLIASGGSAVEERGSELVTWIALAGDADGVAARVRESIRAAAGVDAAVAVEIVPDQDWLEQWRAGLGERRVGERIVVAPTWVDVEAGAADLVIRIDPQMAFGTGEHASTRGVLRLMQRAVQPGTRVLDVGAGSAILGIAAARLGATEVRAVESDPDAIENATDNVVANGVAGRVSVELALVDDAFLDAAGAAAFDGIVANVLSGVLLPLLPGFRRTLADGGWCILSGILAEEAAMMRAAAAHSGFSVEAEDVEEQWWSVLLRTGAPPAQ